MVRAKGDRCHKENTVSSMTDRPINSETDSICRAIQIPAIGIQVLRGESEQVYSSITKNLSVIGTYLQSKN